MKELNLVFVGHVDHGKSSVIGRMLADCNGLAEGKFEALQQSCKRAGKAFEYAFLLDALKDEQQQGITIDAARVFFHFEGRRYNIIDAPGHIEFLKNMISGAARAEAALLIVDASEGVRENSRRHAYFLGMLGIRQVSVLVNKMDTVDYSKERFEQIRKDIGTFFEKINQDFAHIVPVSAMEGDNINSPSPNMPWYEGPVLTDLLQVFKSSPANTDQVFRMFVQDVYKFTGYGDSRRIIAGEISAGRVSAGENLCFYPSGNRAKLEKIESFPESNLQTRSAGDAAGFTLDSQLYIKRGELAFKVSDVAPKISKRVRARIFWLSPKALDCNRSVVLKIGSARVNTRIEKILQVMNASTLEIAQSEAIERHEIGDCILEFEQALAHELVADNPALARFVIVDALEISGGGIITESLPDEQSALREQVLERNQNWIQAAVSVEDRMLRQSQKPCLLLISGEKNAGRKTLARAIERHLFDAGRLVYYLGIGSLIHGLDADIADTDPKKRSEHIRRMAELSYILLDTGLILVITAVEFNTTDFQNLKTILPDHNLVNIWIGEHGESDFQPDIFLNHGDDIVQNTALITRELEKRGIIFGL